MKFYFSSMQSGLAYFREKGQRKSDPFNNKAPWLQNCFPCYFDWYNPNKDGNFPLWTLLGEHVILDSGAFAFMRMEGYSVCPGGRKKVKYDLEHYHQSYMNFIEFNWDKISYFVELDLGHIRGMDTVHRFRKDYRKRGLFDKCIMVWHKVNKEDDFKYMLAAPSKYIGLQGLWPGEPMIPYNYLIKQAFDKGVRVHGFALTNQKILEKKAFFSVDSTSWLSGVIWGQMRGFRDGRILSINAKREHLKLGKNRDVIEVYYDTYQRLIHGIEGVKKAEQFFTNYWKTRGVDWDAQLEKMGTPPEYVVRWPRRVPPRRMLMPGDKFTLPRLDPSIRLTKGAVHL